MKFNIEHLAKLARLDLNEEEKEKFASEVKKILDFVAQLNEADTTGVEPVAHAINISDVKRSDEAKNHAAESLKDELLKAAPQKQGDFIKVKSVFEK